MIVKKTDEKKNMFNKISDFYSYFFVTIVFVLNVYFFVVRILFKHRIYVYVHFHIFACDLFAHL